MDGCDRAERVRGAGVWPASAACGIGRMDRGTEGRVEHVLRTAGAARVGRICPEAGGGAVSRGRDPVRGKFAVEADAGDAADPAAAGGLVAAQARMAGGREAPVV